MPKTQEKFGDAEYGIGCNGLTVEIHMVTLCTMHDIFHIFSIMPSIWSDYYFFTTSFAEFSPNRSLVTKQFILLFNWEPSNFDLHSTEC